MYKLLVVLCLALLTTCGRRSNAPDESDPSAPDRNAFLAHMPALESWALTCRGNIAKDHLPGYAPAETDPLYCDDGDNLAFSGMNCAAGYEFGCEQVRASFDGQRFWRSPARIGIPDQGMPNFSRDMLLGALLYVVAAKDVARFDAMKAYIEAHDGQMCIDRCISTPQTDNYIKIVDLFLHGKTGSLWSGIIDYAMDRTLIQQAKYVPPTYQLELIAEQLWIRRLTGSWTKDLDTVANILVEREPNNPFYEYVARGMSTRFVSLAWQLVPKTKPALRRAWAFADSFQPPNGDGFDRYDPNNSMVWDWIMIGSILRRGY